MEGDNIKQERKKLARQFERLLKNNQTAFFDHECFERIMEHYEDQVNFGKALKATEFALEQYPFSSFFIMKKGEYLLEMKRPKLALEYLNKSIILDSSDLRNYFICCDAHVELEQFDEALEVLQKASEMAGPKELPDVYLEVADVYEEIGNSQAVVDCLKKVLVIQPRNHEAQGRLQLVAELNNWDEQVVTFLNKLTNKDPYAKATWFNLGNAYANLEDFGNAVEAYEMALAINENYEVVYEELGTAYFSLGIFDKAIFNLKESITRNKMNSTAWFMLGKCYKALQEYNKAIYNFSKALNIDVSYYENYYELADCYFLMAKYKQALENINKALNENDKDFDFYILAIEILFKLGDVAMANSYVEHLIISKPSYARHWVAITETLYNAGKSEAAISALTKAEIAKGDMALKYYHLAVYNFDTSKTQQALSHLSEALSLNYAAHPVIFEMMPGLEENVDVIDLIKIYKS